MLLFNCPASQSVLAGSRARLTASPILLSVFSVFLLATIPSGTSAQSSSARSQPGNREKAEPDSVAYFLAREGNDTWSGRLAAPNKGRTDGPFASLARCRDAVVRGVAAGLRVSVLIRKGTYHFDSTLGPYGGLLSSVMRYEITEGIHGGASARLHENPRSGASGTSTKRSKET